MHCGAQRSKPRDLFAGKATRVHDMSIPGRCSKQKTAEHIESPPFPQVHVQYVPGTPGVGSCSRFPMGAACCHVQWLHLQYHDGRGRSSSAGSTQEMDSTLQCLPPGAQTVGPLRAAPNPPSPTPPSGGHPDPSLNLLSQEHHPQTAPSQVSNLNCRSPPLMPI